MTYLFGAELGKLWSGPDQKFLVWHKTQTNFIWSGSWSGGLGQTKNWSGKLILMFELYQTIFGQLSRLVINLFTTSRAMSTLNKERMLHRGDRKTFEFFFFGIRNFSHIINLFKYLSMILIRFVYKYVMTIGDSQTLFRRKTKNQNS